MPPVLCIGSGRLACGCWCWKQPIPPPSVGRCLSVRLFTKARPLWKECGASGVETLADADAVWAQNAVPVLIDPTGACLPQARPAVLVDAIIAKKNLGTTREMAPLTIALGPGFVAGQDVDA